MIGLEDFGVLPRVRESMIKDVDLSDVVGEELSVSKNGNPVVVRRKGHSFGIREHRCVNLDGQIADLAELDVYHACEKLCEAFIESGHLRDRLFFEELDVERLVKGEYYICKGEKLVEAEIEVCGNEVLFKTPDETVSITKVAELTARLAPKSS